MSDDTQDPSANPQQVDAASPEAETSPPTGTESAGQSPVVDWEGRYKGVMQVLSARDKKIQELEASFNQSAASVEELTRQLQTASADGDARVQALTEQLQTLTGERDEVAKELATARADLVKYEALKEYPDLLPLADTIPAIPDPEVMKKHLETMAKGIGEITNAKAKQLTAGMTPGATTPANQPTYAYTSLAEWQTALNKAAGSDEWQEVAAAFRQWESKQH